MKEKKMVEAIGGVNDKFINESMNYKPKKKLIYGACAGLAAVAACLFLVLGMGRFNTNNKVEANSVVSIDINPSIQLTVDDADKIVSAVALNEDAQIVLEGMNLENVDLSTGVNAILGSLLKNGYLEEVYNAINICVENDDEERANELGQKLKEEISNIFDDNDLIGGVNTQYCTTSEELKALAESYGISVGKLCLAQTVSKNIGLSLDVAVQLSICELWDLMDAENIEIITKEEALAVAVADAGVLEEQIVVVSNKIQERAGVFSYVIKFTVGESEMYKYEIDAVSGIVLEREYEYVSKDEVEPEEEESTEGETTEESTTEVESESETEETTKPEKPEKPEKHITKKEALEIACMDACVNEKDIKLDELKHMPKEKQYYIEFAAGTCEYEYVIDAIDGTIISKEVEDKAESNEGEEIAPETIISVEEALNIALEKAGVTIEQVTKYDIKFTNKKTSAEYKIHFHVDKAHYEYIINAVTGEVEEKTHPTPEKPVTPLPGPEVPKPGIEKPVEPDKPVEPEKPTAPGKHEKEEPTKPHEKMEHELPGAKHELR